MVQTGRRVGEPALIAADGFRSSPAAQSDGSCRTGEAGQRAWRMTCRGAVSDNAADDGLGAIALSGRLEKRVYSFPLRVEIMPHPSRLCCGNRLAFRR
ncbi:hypothetical protein EDF70_101629 [Neorhizobium sp. JUb45]|nr:hypothetical protein EDF70_101629 [Neorhizobium sp. JUb45]